MNPQPQPSIETPPPDTDPARDRVVAVFAELGYPYPEAQIWREGDSLYVTGPPTDVIARAEQIVLGGPRP